MSFALVTVLILITCSILVNGWTDAPNAIATVVSTRALPPKAAVLMAAVFNLIGILTMGTAVGNTIGRIISDTHMLSGTNGLVTIAAAQCSIVIWAVTAWRFGIPTSESHALIAALTGAGIAASPLGWQAISALEWQRVGTGLLYGSAGGFIAGFIVVYIVIWIFKGISRKYANRFFTYAQIVSAASMAFNHGAQDGQKFAGIAALALGAAGVSGFGIGDQFTIPLYLMIVCALLMGLGTSIGGYRIIKTMGMDMVKLEKYQGFSAELAASAIMVFSTLKGIPLSTTQAKGTAIMGVGAARGIRHVNLKVVYEMLAAWILTFPICGVLGYLTTKLFITIF